MNEGMSRHYSIWAKMICAMSIKPAQRQNFWQIATTLSADEESVERYMNWLIERGLAKNWGDGSYGLTSKGNAMRNRLV